MSDESSSQPPSGAPPQRTTGGNMRWTPPSPEHMARMLPQYDRWEILGHGGMGAVYKARQPNLDRTVAIKILPPEAADDEAQFIERFKNEARTMAKLDHPGIVAVYDFGETPEGQLYFVMAYVDGTDVAKMIQLQGRLPPAHAHAIAAHVCDALQYAHEHGVIHRDIKPANVLLNHEGTVKVADFGLAKMNDPAQAVSLTKSGMSMGTADFVAPESLTLGMVADHRADLYAVGVMLYQMLTGKIPRGMAKAPSQMVPGVDPRFDAIVEKAMEQDREQRYQSALEIRHALDEILTVAVSNELRDTPSSSEMPQNAAQAAHESAVATPRRRPATSRPKTSPRQSILTMSTLAILATAAVIGAAAFTKKPAGTADPPVLLAQANTTPKSGAGPDAAALPPDVSTKLAELRSTYDQFVDASILKPHEASTATLEANYLKALERARDEATKKGDLDTVVAVKAEMDRLSKEEPLPAGDDALPAAFKPLRTTYRTELSKLEQARDGKIPDANKRYDTALEAYQIQLTQSQQVEAALHVKGLRAELAASTGLVGQAPRLPGQGPAPATGAVVLQPASKDGFTNTLGMKFVQVPGTDVLFCIHETRYKDYAAYAAEAQGVDGSWKNQSADGFTPTDRPADHPVMKVNWEDAQAFCAWLSKKEGKTYRLPTDEEWSIAVGLGRAEKRTKDTTPAMLSQKEPTEFPWGGDFPPKSKDMAGNYSDESRKAKVPLDDAQYLEGYDDGFPTTAPVMSFKPNKPGIYDLGGNVWEWCEDWYDNGQKERVLRGGAWHSLERIRLLSSRRIPHTPTTRHHHNGFRCVVEVR